MVVRVDESSGGGDGFGEEVAVSLVYVVAVFPQVLFSDKRLGIPDAMVKSELAGSDVVGVDVGRGRDEERRGFKEDNVLAGEEFDEMV